MKTTLNKIRERDPCHSGWATLLRHLNKTKPDDDELSILTILESNDIADAIWCLRCVDDIAVYKFKLFCGNQVRWLMRDPRSLKALDILAAYIKGEATKEELDAANAAADVAVADAAVDAVAVAVDAVAVAVDTAADAAYSAKAAANAAANAAATNAAYDAAYATAYAAAYAAADSARKKIRAEQETELRRLCNENN